MQALNAHLLQSVRPIDNRVLAVVEALAVTLAIYLAAQIRIPLPWTPVPVTLQTFPVLASAFVVGRNRALWGILVYLLAGFLMTAYNTEGPSPFAAAFGPTVGYLLAFAAVPHLVTLTRRPALGMLTATFFIYAVGTIWLTLWTRSSIPHALMLGVVPFIPGDIVKGVAAYAIARSAARSKAETQP